MKKVTQSPVKIVTEGDWHMATCNACGWDSQDWNLDRLFDEVAFHDFAHLETEREGLA